MAFYLESPTAESAAQIAIIWEAGWHEAHAAIVPQALTALRTVSSFQARTIEHLAHTCVAKIGSEVVGFCMVKDAEVYQMYVSQASRGTGAARALLEDAERRIRVAEHVTAWLACAVGNQRAAAFYEKCGWHNVGNETMELDTSQGGFPLELWRFEKKLTD
ncbi:MAG: GNAT family N-acetyltransferase [Roseobacter sp.]